MRWCRRAAFALSLGRSRLRCCAMGRLRRRRWWRGRTRLGGSGWVPMWWCAVGGEGGGGGGGGQGAGGESGRESGEARAPENAQPRPQGSDWASELRAHVAGLLPDYMVPSAFVLLDRLPLAANGELDRRALPAAVVRGSVEGGGPRTPQEEILCGLFAEVLGLGRVGTDDNFFELGGDSIVSIQLVSRARKAGLAISPRAVFQHQTVGPLAAVGVAR